jgi:DNA polymerase-1
VVGDAAIEKLVKTLLQQSEICIDTETTGVDAKNVSSVGLTFSL